MNRKKLLLASIAVLLVLAMAVPAAMSYFTTYVRAAGDRQIHLSDETTFSESPNDKGGKHVVIQAAKGSDPVFVRVMIFAPDEVMEHLTVSRADDWDGPTEEDGILYWYYKNPIKDGETAEMDIDIEVPKDFAEDTFNVVVVHEYVPAQVGEDGELFADWDDTDLIIDNEGESSDPAEGADGGGSEGDSTTGGDTPAEGGDGQ